MTNYDDWSDEKLKNHTVQVEKDFIRLYREDINKGQGTLLQERLLYLIHLCAKRGIKIH